MKKTTETSQELREQAKKLNLEATKLEEEEYVKNILPALKKKYINTYWRYWNCYSCLESEADYWWLYMKVVSVDDDGYCQVVICSIPVEGPPEIKIESSMARAKSLEDIGYQKCTKKQWDSNLKKFMKLLDKALEETNAQI